MNVSLNVPLEVLLSQPALHALDAARIAAGIAAERITLELTEEHPLSGLERLGAAVTWLRQIGYGLAIDDVGPETRDHTALLSLPFTMLKLDRALVRAATHQSGHDAFLRGAVAGARSAGMTVVAEGIETPEQWAYALDVGIDAAQGFLISRAMPLSAVGPWLYAWPGERTR